MKKYLAFILAALMLFALCACGAEEPEPITDPSGDGDGGATQMVNPMAETDAAGIKAAIGEDLDVPAGAEDVYYYLIDGTLGQADFTYNGNDYTLRIQKTDAFEDISGVYFTNPIVNDYDEEVTIKVEEDGSMGAATWYDDGCSYSISMGEGASDTLLIAMYELVD